MNIIGICGDNCSFCPRYLATQSGDASELENVKELWVRLGLRTPDFPAQDMACSGCRPENDCAYGEVRACALGEGVENCGLCREYPCKQLAAVFEKTEKLRCDAARLFTPTEMAAFHQAFFSKRQNLGRIHFAGDNGKR